MSETPIPENALPDRALQWIIDAVDPAATIHATERLHGGASSLVHGVSLRVGSGIQEFVLRRFDNARWLQDEPDLARHEAESLRRAALATTDTPGMVAFDETGGGCGVPAVLMTRLAGTVVLNPSDERAWLDGLAESLARIHAIDADGFPWEYFTYTDLAARETPTWSHVPALWGKAIRLVQAPRPAFVRRFIHRDYHPANVLWSGDRVSGVVDWVNACAGPAGIDVGHCRVNLAQLFGVATADAFLAVYEAHAGATFQHDPYWDLVSLFDICDGPPAVYAGWTALGVTGLTDERMRERLDGYLASLMRRGVNDVRKA